MGEELGMVIEEPGGFVRRDLYDALVARGAHAEKRALAAEAARDALLTDLEALADWFENGVSNRMLRELIAKHRAGGEATP